MERTSRTLAPALLLVALLSGLLAACTDGSDAPSSKPRSSDAPVAKRNAAASSATPAQLDLADAMRAITAAKAAAKAAPPATPKPADKPRSTYQSADDCDDVTRVPVDTEPKEYQAVVSYPNIPGLDALLVGGYVPGDCYSIVQYQKDARAKLAASGTTTTKPKPGDPGLGRAIVRPGPRSVVRCGGRLPYGPIPTTGVPDPYDLAPKDPGQWGVVPFDVADSRACLVPTAKVADLSIEVRRTWDLTAVPTGGTEVPVSLVCEGCDFRGVDLTAANLQESIFIGGSFAGAKLQHANLSGTLLMGVDFSGADLTDADLTKANVLQSRFGALDGKPAVLDRTVLTGTHMWATSLDGAVLRNLDFAGATLPCTTFRGDVLLKAVGVDVPTISWAQDDIDQVYVDVFAADPEYVAPKCDKPFDGAVMEIGALSASKSVDMANVVAYVEPSTAGALAGADLTGAKLAGLRFLGMAPDLRGVVLANAVLDGADLAHLRFTPATAGGKAANLSKASAVGTDFRGASLQGATLTGADLRSARFTSADLAGASLVGATASSTSGGQAADFSHISAPGANFGSIVALRSSFVGAHVYGKGASFANAKLGNATFTDALLAQADFNGADLSGASFDKATCVQCNLTAVTFTDAKFNAAYLSGANLSKPATVSNANFQGAITAAGTKPWRAPLPPLEPPLAVTATATVFPTSMEGAVCPNGDLGSATTGCAGKLAVTTVAPGACTSAGPFPCPAVFATQDLPDGVLPVDVITDPATGDILSLSGDGKLIRGTGSTAKALTIQGLSNTAAIVADPRGGYLVADGDQVWIVDPKTGSTKRFAGRVDPKPGHDGDGGPALDAQLYGPLHLWADPVGNVFIAETDRIRKVDLDGTISTVAVTGTSLSGLSGDRWGSLYASDTTAHQVFRVDPTGAVTPFAGTGTAGYDDRDWSTAQAASKSKLDTPQDVEVVDRQTADPTGTDPPFTVLIADRGNRRLRPVNSAGNMEAAVAGTGGTDVSPSGTAAAEASIAQPIAIWVSPDGQTTYVASYRVGGGASFIAVLRPSDQVPR